MASKRKDITNLDDLLGGKPGATGTAPQSASPPADIPRARLPVTPTDPAVTPAAESTARTRPIKTRDDQSLAREYAQYGKPWAVRLPEQVIADLKEVARHENIDLQTLTRWVLQQFVADYQASRVDIDRIKKPIRYQL